jgi:prevent-host-death family protein
MLDVMLTVTVAEAKANFAAVLDRVARGERVTVTRRGAAAAVLVPPSEAPDHDPPVDGLSSLLGFIAEFGIDDDAWDETMSGVVASRADERSRPVPDL